VIVDADYRGVKLGRAYETLKDTDKRRAYDLLYPSITGRRPSTQTPQTPRPPPESTSSTSQAEALSEAAQIAAVSKLKRERFERWIAKKNIHDSSVFELQRQLRRLEQEIKNLDSIAAAEAAAEAQKKSWSTWFLSPLYKKVEENEEEEARKDRERQERRVEKDMKERRMALKKAELTREEGALRKGKEELDAADKIDDDTIRSIQARRHLREFRERQERERAETIKRERAAYLRRQEQEQRERQQREAAEVLRKKQAEARAAADKKREENARAAAEVLRKEQVAARVAEEMLRKKRAEAIAAANRKREEEDRQWKKTYADLHNRQRQQSPQYHYPQGSTHRTHSSSCEHRFWWPKVQGRAACPECSEVWTYLLQCPGCQIMACPKCQAQKRGKYVPHHKAGARRRDPPPRAKSPSLEYSYEDYY
jgi:hypothetical protein